MRLGKIVARIFLAFPVLQVAAALGQAAAPLPQVPAAAIVYRNAQYGFCFVLPATWKGYTIVPEQWRGSDFTSHQVIHGPQLRIRHPGWTQENPYQDIPIMIFTPQEWKKVVAVTMSVSAAPIGPEELGANGQYVFALPPRWIGFDDAIGQDEVDSWMSQNRLQAPCAEADSHP